MSSHRTNGRLSRKEREHLEFYVLTVEKERSEPLSDADVERIIVDMRSDDPQARARAVREICPCRVSWEVFNRLRRAAKALRNDPDPIVAANAIHIEQDARRVAANEAQVEQLRELEQARQVPSRPWKTRHARGRTAS